MKRSAGVLCWLLVFALILAFGWFKSGQNRRESERVRIWFAKIRRLSTQADPTLDWLYDGWRELHRDPNARELVKARMAAHKDAKLVETNQQDDATTEYVWHLGNYGVHFKATFRGDDWIADDIAQTGKLLKQQNPRPPQEPSYASVEQVRKLVAENGFILWLALLAAALPMRGGGANLALAMLAVAMAVGTAQAVSPAFSITVQGIFSNDLLVYSGVMYVVSLLFVGRAAAVRNANATSQQDNGRLQFQIRGVLLLMCVVGAFLAMGPFGYFALIMVAVGVGVVLATQRAFQFATAAPGPSPFDETNSQA